MSGHSKWSTIKRAKGAADIKRGLTFTKLGNAITIAAKLGGSGDPDSNPRLRLAVDQARASNMPKENVQRAIDRGLGKLPGQTIEEVVFEGFGPGKVAVLVEGVTDNKLRTLQTIKNLFDRNGGALGSQGSTSYMFDKKGEIIVVSQGGAKDDEMLELIDMGAEDVEDFEEEGVQKYLVYTQIPSLTEMSNKIAQAGFTVDSSEMVNKPNIVAEITEKEKAEKVLHFISLLEGSDDVQRVSANFVIPDNIMDESA
jgi:YebC/PmpR family DNA-binding regulatory protein